MSAPGRLTWRDPSDGLAGTLDRYPPNRWCATITRPGVPGAAAAVRDTREEAQAAVPEMLAMVREGEARRVAGRTG